MSPEEKAREVIDKKLIQSGWVVQDMKNIELTAALGVAVREFPTSSGEVDYALFVDGTPVGVIEAKRSDAGENITAVEKHAPTRERISPQSRSSPRAMQTVPSNISPAIIISALLMKRRTSSSVLRITMTSNSVRGRCSPSTAPKRCKRFCGRSLPSGTI